MREILAYIAGIVDGEGCIQIQKNPTKFRSPGYSARVTVAMATTQVIQLLKELFGGNIYVQKIRNTTMYRWEINSQQARRFLENIYEFLRIKDDQAQLAIELELRKKMTVNRKFGLSQKEIDKREEMFQKIRRLKKC